MYNGVQCAVCTAYSTGVNGVYINITSLHTHRRFVQLLLVHGRDVPRLPDVPVVVSEYEVEGAGYGRRRIVQMDLLDLIELMDSSSRM